MTMRRAILLLALLLLLLPSAAQAQPAYGAGNANDASGKPVAARTVEAADSPSLVAWATLLTAFVAPNSLGLPALALGAMGWDGTNMRVLSVSAAGILGVADATGNGLLATIDADTGILAGTVTGNRVAVNLISGATGIYGNAGTTGTGSPRVTQATKATADTLTSTNVAQAAGDTAILVTSPASAVIWGTCCQNRDADGPIVVAPAAATAAGTLGARLDPANVAGRSGGSACFPYYSGPMTGFAEAAGTTVTVSCWRL